jgi:hypothetical protein
VVDPSNGQVELRYAIDGGIVTTIATVTATASLLDAIQQSNKDLAVGFIGTSNTSGVELEGTWDFLQVKEIDEEEPQFPLAINVGGDQLDYNGKTFSADRFFDGGQSFENPDALVPDLYKTERSSLIKTFSYEVPLENGDYSVDLHFAEIYWGATGGGPGAIGSRVFDVSIEDDLVLDDYDIFADVGAETIVIKSYEVNVNDGLLEIDFTALAADGGADQPKVSAIEIRKDLGNFPSLNLSPIANQTNLVNENVDFGVTATGGDPNVNFAYSISGQPSGITIEPTNGLIYGSVDAIATSGGVNNDGVHNVTVTVSKTGSDPVFEDFTWTINELGWIDKDENENYTGRHECSFVQAGDKFYLMGGRESAKSIDVYDYETDTWSTLTNSAPFEFNHFQAVEYQGLIWIIGAFETNNFPNEVSAAHIWTFDPANEEWILGPVIPESRRRGSAALVVHNDKFYVIGGNTNGHSGGFVPFFDEYDPLTATWTSLTDAPRARDHFSAAVIDNKLYLSGGRQTSSTGGYFSDTLSEVDVYDFSTSSWSTLPSNQNLPTERAGAAVVNFNDKLIVIGGEIAEQFPALKTTEQYDPLQGSWQQLPDMNYPRHSAQAIVSGNGIIVAAGSPNQGGGNQKNMEVLGEDAPEGIPLVSSNLTGPNLVSFESVSNEIINVEVSGGNTAVILKSMSISGPDAADFAIASGQLMDGLLKANTSREISIEYSGNNEVANAELTINYGKSGQLVIPLEANITVADYTLTVNNGTGDGQYEADTIVPLVADSAPVDQEFDSWTGDVSGIADVNSASTTITMPAANTTVSATYSDVATEPMTTFTMVNAGDDSDLFDITNGQQILSSSVDGLLLNVRANPSTTNVGSVHFELTGALTNTRTENVAVYALYGDVSGDYYGVDFPLGDYTMSTTVYSGGNRTGDVLDVQTISFSIVLDEVENMAPVVTNPGTQNNEEGDQVSLQIVATDDGSTLTYEATNLPLGLSIDAQTGLITGSISGSDESPYDVVVTVTDDGTPVLNGSTQFNWNVSAILIDYTLTVNNGTGDGQYEADTIVPLVADSAPVDQEFDSWTGDVSGIADVNSASTTITMPAANTTVSATYSDVATEPMTTFTMVNAGDDSDLFDITNGQQILSSSVDGLLLNVRANPSTTNVGSVHFELTGALTNTRTENVAVYALYGDVSGDYYGVDFPLGDYTMSTTVYSGGNRTGDVLDVQTISFSIVLDEVENMAPVVTNPGTQNNEEGDQVSLQIVATDDGSTLTYEATNLPLGLSIDAQTGLISGTILSGDTSGGAFQESNGLVVIEAESGSIVPGWSETNASGATGIIASTNSFNSQNGGMIPYEIEIQTPGVYRFEWRNFYSGSTPTDENDSWLKFPNNDDVWFFAHRGTVTSEASLISNVQGSQTNILFPKGSSRVTPATTPAGAGGNGYFKAYRSGGVSETYSWQALTNDGIGFQIYVWFVNSGTYTMEIAERSSGHAIDKIAMYKVDGTQYTGAQLTAASESTRTVGNDGAAASSPYDVVIEVTDDGTPVLTSNIAFVWNVGLGTEGVTGRGGSIQSNNVGAYIYPNPAISSINVKPLNDKSVITKVVLFDMLGRKINTLKVSNIDLTEEGVKFPLDNVQGGFYLLQLQFDNLETKMLKVLVRD